jgi:hypothetical protein
MSTMPVRASFSGPDLQALLEALRSSPFVPDRPPIKLSVDNRAQTPSADWLERATTAAKRGFFAAWDEDYEHFLDYVANTILKVSNPDAPRDPAGTLAWIHKLPFHLASLEDAAAEFLERPDYPGPGFSDMHYPLGWACAFQGDGHRRLVSRRWLEFGPWRLLKGENNTSFVQFHDLNADPETAWNQAQPGHERMGISDTGGFIQSQYVYQYPIDGLYNPDERRLRVLIHGRPVSQREMLDACAVRLYQALGPARPVDTVAYVFAVEEEARAHLHELWLRELECRAIIAGREVRLDTDYTPRLQQPEWVLALE